MRAIASNALSIAIVRGAPLACRVLLLLAMAHWSSAAELTRAGYAIAIAEAVRFVAGGGLEIWAIRALGRAVGEEEVSRTCSAMAFVKLVLGFAGGLVAVALTRFSGDGGPLLALSSGVLVLAGEAFGIAVIYYLARGTPGALIPVSVALGIFATAGVCGALALGAGSAGVCALIAASETIASLFVLGRLRAARVLARHPGLVAQSIDVLRQSLPTTLYGGIVAIYTRLDAIALNAFSVAAFASYTVAFRITQPFVFVFGAIALATYANQAGHSMQRDTQSHFGLRGLFVAIFGLATVAALATYFVCAWLISALVPAYLDSLASLRFLCAMIPFAAVNNVGLYMLAGTSRFTALIGVVTLNLAATASLMWVLVPAMGAQGAALTLLAVQVLNSVVMFLIGTRSHAETLPA